MGLVDPAVGEIETPVVVRICQCRFAEDIRTFYRHLNQVGDRTKESNRQVVAQCMRDPSSPVQIVAGLQGQELK